MTIESAAAGTTTAQMVELAENANAGPDATPPIARLYLSRDSTPGASGDVKVNLAAPSFAELVQANHETALAMLGEGLTALRSMHVLSGVSQADARAIFAADETVDEATQRQIDSIVAALDKGGSEAIPALRAKLRPLGLPAAAALSARPHDGWSVDLAMNVETLVAGLLPVQGKRAGDLLASPGRMIDLLYSPDASTRRAVVERLAKRSTEPLNFDASADPYTQVAKIEAIRARLDPVTAR